MNADAKKIHELKIEKILFKQFTGKSQVHQLDLEETNNNQYGLLIFLTGSF